MKANRFEKIRNQWINNKKKDYEFLNHKQPLEEFDKFLIQLPK